MKALAARVESRRNAGEKAKAVTKTAVDGTSADDLTTVGAQAAVAAMAGQSPESTGPRQQPKKNTTRSQRKKK